MGEQNITWNTSEGKINPTDSDIERTVDEIVKYLNENPEVGSVEIAGLVVVRNPPVFDIYVNVGAI